MLAKLAPRDSFGVWDPGCKTVRSQLKMQTLTAGKRRAA